VLPGVRINLSKRGASVSAGVRGAHITIGPTETRTTVGLPGTGLSYTDLQKPGSEAPWRGYGLWLALGAIAALAVLVWASR
jgi:hypothetical protein